MGFERSIGGAGALLFLLSFVGAAHADDAAPRFHLVYEAPAECPDRPAFLAAIHAQTPRPQLADDGESAVSLAVTIEVGRSAVSGRLDVREEPDGLRETRSVSSRTCAEVAKALALVAAVILDPDARTATAAEPPPTIEEPPPSATAPARPPSPPPPPAKAPPQRPWRLSAGVELGALGGIGPAIAPMGSVFVDGELSPGVTRLRSPLFTPALRIGAEVAATSSDVFGGSQRYQWFGGSLRLCPLHVPLPARLRIAPCAGLEVGAHRGSTVDVPAPTRSVDLRIAPTLGGSLEWALSSSLTLELMGAALFPLRRSRFFLAPSTTIFEIPVVTAMAGLGLRVRFF